MLIDLYNCVLRAANLLPLTLAQEVKINDIIIIIKLPLSEGPSLTLLLGCKVDNAGLGGARGQIGKLSKCLLGMRKGKLHPAG